MLPRPHPWPVRVAHWAVALAVVLLVLSGWRIYDANPFFGFRIPESITLGGWLAGALQWHFTVIWLLGAGGLFYLAYTLATGRLGRKMLPVSPPAVLHEVGSAVRFRLHHDDLDTYNHTQRLAYLVAIFALVLLVLSGLVLWKPVQFPLLRTLLGDYETARRIHFLAMSVIVAFTLVHVLLVVLVPRTLSAMIGLFAVQKETR